MYDRYGVAFDMRYERIQNTLNNTNNLDNNTDQAGNKDSPTRDGKHLLVLLL